MVLLDVVIFVVSAIILVRAGEYVVKALTGISKILDVKPFVLAFILMAFSTSLPETFVGITSAFKGNPTLSLGNVVGSNIANASIILGIIIILGRGIKITSQTIGKDMKYMLFIAAAPLLLLIDGTLSRIDGILLLAVFGMYVVNLMNQNKFFHNLHKDQEKGEIAGPLKELMSSLVMFGMGLIFMIASSNFLVGSAINISDAIGVPPIIVGLMVIAFGTSLPELTFGIKSAMQGQGQMALGDLIGAVVVNSTFVLGITAIITPIEPHTGSFIVSAFFMMIILFLFAEFAAQRKSLSIREGLWLIMLYILFVFTELYFQYTGY